MSRLDTHWSEQGMEITRKEGTVIVSKAGPVDRQAGNQQIHRRPQQEGSGGVEGAGGQ